MQGRRILAERSLGRRSPDVTARDSPAARPDGGYPVPIGSVVGRGSPMSLSTGAAMRTWRRLGLAYVLTCAREDARVLGLAVPDGVWFCAPCRLAFLDGWDVARHRFAHSG